MTKIIIYLLIISNTFIFSQEVDLSTPRQTVRTHLHYLQKDNYNPELSSKVFKGIDEKKAIDLAKKLKRYYDSKGLYIDLDEISNDKDYFDSTTKKNRFYLFPKNEKIYLTKNEQSWYYSNETINNIPELYSTIHSDIIEELVSDLPDFAYERILGLKVWKYFAMLIILLISVIFYFIFRKIIGFYLIRGIDLIIKNKDIEPYLAPVNKPISLLIVLTLIYHYYPYLMLPFGFSNFINALFLALFPILIVFILFKIVDLFSLVLAILTKKTETQVDDQLVPIIRKAAKIAVFIIGIFYFVDNFGWDYTPLLAGASVGGLAFALAAQDTVKNFFGSVTIFTDKPFDVGDAILFDGNAGIVEEVGVRSTRIRTFYNSLVSIPNGKLADMVVDNMGRRQYRRLNTNIGVTYDTPPDIIELYVEGLNKLVMTEKYTRKFEYDIYLNSFEDSSLSILVNIFFEVENWTQELQARQSFMIEAIKLAEELGIRFAFPTSTLFVEDFPEKQSKTPEYTESKEYYKGKLDEYLVHKSKRNGKDNS